MKRIDKGFIIIVVVLLGTRLVNGSMSDPKEYFFNILIMLPGIIIGFTFHEFAHAFVSDRLGDPTPKQQGRLSINPMAHIDWIGFASLVLCGFGWGKPVEINPMYYKNRRLGELLTALAGVVMNLLIAFILCFVLKALVYSDFANTNAGDVIIQMTAYAVTINLVLMIFNLIPVPPLDGFGILTQIFDLSKYRWYPYLYDNGFFILLLLIVFNITDMVITPGVTGIWNFMMEHIVY